MDCKEMAMNIAKLLNSKKAIDVDVIDIGAKSGFADYFIMASGTAERQIGALADYVEDEFALNQVEPKGIEGKPGSGWILMDYGDIIVNLLTVEMRGKYNIEKVWNDCEIIRVEDEAEEEE